MSETYEGRFFIKNSKRILIFGLKSNAVINFIRYFWFTFPILLVVQGLVFPIFAQHTSRSDSLIIELNIKARYYFNQGNFEDSKNTLEELLVLKKKFIPENIRSIANSYVNLSSTYKIMWDFENAIDMIFKANDLYFSIDSTIVFIGSNFINISNIYTIIGDFEKAEQYNNYAVSFFDRFGHKKDLYNINYLRGIIHSNLKDPQRARKHWLEAARQTPHKYMVYNALALSYIETGEIEEAERYYREILSLPDLKDYEMYRVYLNYGIFLFEQRKDKEKALYYYGKALENIQEYHPQSKNLFSIIYHNYGEFYYSGNELTKALEYFQKSIILSSKDFTNPDYLSNPETENIVNLSMAYSSFKFKAKVLFDYFTATNDIRYLESSLDVSNICFEIINKMRYRIVSEGSQFSISEKEKDVYMNGITTAYYLYSLSGNISYLHQAFQINEMRKAFVLLAKLRNQKAMLYGKIPQDLLDKEKDLNRKLSFYEEQIFVERQKKEQDITKITSWEDLLGKYNVEYDVLLRTFEKEYPDYYDLKYRTNYLSPPDVVRKLKKDEAVLAYSLSDSILFTFILSRESLVFNRQVVGETLEDECNQLYKLITKQNFSKNAIETYRQYIQQAYRLYNLLIEPFENHIEGKNLIIIADGAISYLPFDALLTQKVNEGEVDYRALPYMLHKHSVAMSYSSTLQFQGVIENKPPKKSVLAFAPTYGNLLLNSLQSENPLSHSDRYNLIVLPGIRDEVKKISNHVRTDIYMDYNATESNFKKLASDYEVLHLAMHTLLDDDNPLHSKMAFTQLTDTLEDGFLHAFEIYNMQLNAKLVVLSSCSSGFGKLQEGDGMQSIARSFSYAGCPSILMSLWEVADQATVTMMDYFYKHLSAGHSKPEALRLSKLNFLKEADNLRSNPYFWSTFIIMGNTSPIYKTTGFSNWLWFLSLLIIPVIILYIGRSTRKCPGWILR